MSVEDCVTGRAGITTGMPDGTGGAMVKLSLTLATPPPPATYGMTRAVIVGISRRTLVVKMVARPSVPDTVEASTEVLVTTSASPLDAISVDGPSAFTSGFIRHRHDFNAEAEKPGDTVSNRRSDRHLRPRRHGCGCHRDLPAEGVTEAAHGADELAHPDRGARSAARPRAPRGWRRHEGRRP